MGLGVKALIPGMSVDPDPFDAPVTESRFNAELDLGVGPKLLVSAFMPNGPGLLSALLKVLDDGVTVALSPATQVLVRFSIEGSIASAVGNSFILAFLAKPISQEPAALPESLVKSILEQSVCRTLAEVTSEDEGAVRDRVRVLPFSPISDSLFLESQFTEYRVATREKDSLTGRAALANWVGAVASLASDHRVPIAYLYFPDDSPSFGEGYVGARIGLASPITLRDKVRFDLACIMHARTQSLKLLKYDPTVPASSLDDRFIQLADYSVAPMSSVSYGSSQVDAVFVEGAARVGYVADMLAGPVPDLIVGGTMAVVGGHTVACWVAPEANGNLLEGMIRENCSQTAGTYVFHRTVPTGAPNTRKYAKKLWLEWRAPDQAGIFRQILDGLRAVATGLFGTSACIDVSYSTSRVLDSGASCVGKMRFEVSADVSILEDVENVFTAELRGSGWWSLIPGLQTSSQKSLEVTIREPSEGPWASLGLT